MCTYSKNEKLKLVIKTCTPSLVFVAARQNCATRGILCTHKHVCTSLPLPLKTKTSSSMLCMSFFTCIISHFRDDTI